MGEQTLHICWVSCDTLQRFLQGMLDCNRYLGWRSTGDSPTKPLASTPSSRPRSPTVPSSSTSYHVADSDLQAHSLPPETSPDLLPALTPRHSPAALAGGTCSLSQLPQVLRDKYVRSVNYYIVDLFLYLVGALDVESHALTRLVRNYPAPRVYLVNNSCSLDGFLCLSKLAPLEFAVLNCE